MPSEVGKALSGGVHNLRLSFDERSLLWETTAGERISRPADAIHVLLWRKLRASRQEAEAAFNQIGMFLIEKESNK